MSLLAQNVACTSGMTTPDYSSRLRSEPESVPHSRKHGPRPLRTWPVAYSVSPTRRPALKRSAFRVGPSPEKILLPVPAPRIEPPPPHCGRGRRPSPPAPLPVFPRFARRERGEGEKLY